MPDTPRSPPARRLAAPSWLDSRLVLGVLLVLVSVVVGARLLSSADQSTLVWAAARDVAPGVVLTEDDFEPSRVRLFTSAQQERYVSAVSGQRPVHYVSRVSLARGDLVPRSALVDLSTDTDFRQFTLNVRSGHAPPDLRGGQQVDLYVTPERGEQPQPQPGPTASPGLAGSKARLVLPAVSVQYVPPSGGPAADDTSPVVLNVAPSQVLGLVRAVAEGPIDLVRVRGQDEVQPRATPGAG